MTFLENTKHEGHYRPEPPGRFFFVTLLAFTFIADFRLAVFFFAPALFLAAAVFRLAGALLFAAARFLAGLLNCRETASLAASVEAGVAAITLVSPVASALDTRCKTTPAAAAAAAPSASPAVSFMPSAPVFAASTMVSFASVIIE